MRLNQFLASASKLSRRSADDAIARGEVKVNNQVAEIGQQIDPDSDQVTLSGRAVRPAAAVTIILNKPVGYVTSRRGQGSQTIYDLLPSKYQQLKPAGRLDKDSSGLLVLTSDGHLANRLIHPSQGKTKRYRITLDRPLESSDLSHLTSGVELAEGLSRLQVIEQVDATLTLDLTTGWNRQIRRTFEALGYQVKTLQRTAIGQIELGELKPGECRALSDQEATWLSS